MKLRLMVQSGSLAGHHLEWAEGVLLLGRSADCSLKFNFDQDHGVSKYHARLESRPDGFFIVDLNSTNGTFVNGEIIRERALQTNDVIRLSSNGPQMLVLIESTSVNATETVAPAPVSSSGNASKTAANLSFYDPEREKDPAPSGIRFGLFIGAFMGLVVMTILVLTIGLKGTIVGTIMAFLPAPFYMLLFIWLDRYDPEPPWALIAAFAWGGLFSIFISFILNSLFGNFAAAFAGEPAGLTLSAIVSAPLVEEGSKGLGILLILLFLRREFDGILDGIVYAGIIALGFATIENVLYYGLTFEHTGGSGLLLILFLRGVLSPFAHSLFTSMTGIGCGIARETHNKTLRFLAPVIGYVGAVMLHSLWNALASFTGNKFFFVYFGVWVPLFLVFLTVTFVVGRRERLILREMLVPEVATGLLLPQQMEILTSSLRRVSWLIASLSNWKQLMARRHFLRAASKLGFCYWHASRAAAANQETISLAQIPKFRKEIAALQVHV